MLTKIQDDFIHQLATYGIQYKEVIFDGLPAFELTGFSFAHETILVPMIDSKVNIFQVVCMSEEPIENKFVDGTKKNYINTNIRNIEDLIYLYYHFYKINKQTHQNTTMDVFWEKLLNKFEYKEKFNSDYLKKSIENYFLNSTLTTETIYFKK